MSRPKRVDPDPLETFTLEDGTIVEIRDESCQIKSRGSHKTDAYVKNRDNVLMEVVPMYVSPAGRKKLGRRQKDILKSGAEFERWYTLQGYPERDESQIRDKLYKDVKRQIESFVKAIENK